MLKAVPVIQISNASTPTVASRGVAVPTYNRSMLRPRIAHLGVGGFHRAHMALYTDDAAALGSLWGIRGLGILDADAQMADALGGQDNLYTLTERGEESSTTRLIGSIVDVVVDVVDSGRARGVVADPDTRILSLTITEAGYGPPTVARPRTTFDVIAGWLEARRLAKAGPITIMSCDNLPGNGDVAKKATIDAAARHSRELHHWVAGECTFPNSMVDRITPVPGPAQQGWLLDQFGIVDSWPVVAEPFKQWVVQDDFAAGRPDWHDVGVLFTNDVHAWELYKLRLLNAGHSTIAYLSALAGIEYVDEALATPAVRKYLTALLQTEAAPTLTVIPGHPTAHYIQTVLERFSSRGIRDQIARLCIDGTAKFPTFVIPTIERQLAIGGPIGLCALALAGWARYLGFVPESQQAFDANGSRSRTIARAASIDPLRFLELDAVFPNSLRSNDRFRQAFADSAHLLAEAGPLEAMMSSVRSHPSTTEATSG